MRKIFPVFSALVTFWAADVLVCPLAYAQNEIDYINSFCWSGYGKMAIDRDTLYLNSLNGHGVERYYIADPANPQFIDRTQISGFDQIDFERRLMADFRDDRIILADFGNFESTRVLSFIPIPPQEQYYHWPSWKLLGEYLFIALDDDSIRTYDIADPANPKLTAIVGLYRQESHLYGESVIFGSSVSVVYNDNYDWAYEDVYDICQPDSIHLVHSDTIGQPSVGGYGIAKAKGDTLVAMYVDMMNIQWCLWLVSYASNDTSSLPYWCGHMEGEWPPAEFLSDFFGFIIWHVRHATVAYSYKDFVILGKIGDILSPNFEFSASDYLIWPLQNCFRAFQPTYSDTITMPLVAEAGPPHFGILSTCSYGNCILSGAESNGGELLVHELNENDQLALLSVVPDVEAKGIIIDGSSALCLCPDKIVQVGLTDPSAPVIRHELTGFGQELLDFALEDSLLFVISDRTFYVIGYDSLAGMEMASTLEFTPGSLTSMDNYHTASVVLQGQAANLIKISALDPSNPQIIAERQLRPDTFQNVEVMYATIWASGRHGTDVLNIYTMDSTAFFGPQYFLDVHKMYVVPDTLFVADGINGLRVFDFEFYPYGELHYIGGYSTGNVVRQVATIGNDFFLADYYSLQHLRWGAPTGVVPDDENPLPNEIALYQNYPNPFNARTTIECYLPKAGRVTIDIFDIMGRKVQTLVEGTQEAGRHVVVWDAGDFSSGIYFYRMKTNEFTQTDKCILLK